ncbi:GH92 family glycosyl hydrolase [Pinibacter aurantiacus]|uniref:GH92 family glycosyl hydrolase n=1 Tax=Pinibacter aurantiacus TaxID=2851599 RepID=A0A9E2W711_9BACT|nr:GH92 family glycosyl hydrolase [Pinibacter aurantiacus]MBV4355906.1 GH92 family glycosyl hydrolase [Pinibacter aurantiacus]
MMKATKKVYAIAISWCMFSCGLSPSDSLAPRSSNVQYINPLIGNVGIMLEPTRPTVQLPNQMIRFTPQRKDYLDDQVSSFPLTVVSHRLGQVFALMPTVQPIHAGSWQNKLAYDHDLEINQPWYYSNYFIEDDIKTEFTPSSKSGIFKFTFPSHGDAALLFSTYSRDSAAFQFTNGNIIEGFETYHDSIKVYAYGMFSEKGTTGFVNNNAIQQGNNTAGKNVKAFIRFENNTKNVEFKYAISFVSQAQAKKNFDDEVAGKSFDETKELARNAWDKTMSQIEVEGGSDEQRKVFYTALYRCYERMVNISEGSNYYSGFDGKVHADSRPFYTDDWSWDTYLALHPLRTILHPQQEEDMVQSYVRMYQQSGWLPTFPVLFGDHACMNGFHSSEIILDAYNKGLRNFDVDAAYEGMKKNSLSATMLPWRNGKATSLDDFYYNHGYFPALYKDEKETVADVHPFEKRQAVAVTLGASYDSWAAYKMAVALHKYDDTALLKQRSNDYKNLWNKERGFFLPKDEKGNWINIDAKYDGGPGGRDYYDENNGWTYVWQVQQDIPSLINLMGGKQKFQERLDQLFREGIDMGKNVFWYKFPDATSLVGQYSMANEPSFHIPYLYNYTDAPWKTQRIIRALLKTWFRNDVFGIPGDEDGGGMSAFVVLSSMGFYPVTPGIPVYTIGSPVFSKVVIHLENGKDFTVVAHNCSDVNKYIQSARMNGKELNTPWFTHEQIMNGGTLELEMDSKPNKQWGH